MEGVGHPLQALTAPGTLPDAYFKGMLGTGKRHGINERKGPSSVSLL